MKRTNDLLDIFSAEPGETIRVSIRAINTVFIATHSSLSAGTPWNNVQTPAAGAQMDIREFTMPSSSDSFAVLYQFSPPPIPGPQSYEITFNGAAGSSDGPIVISHPGVSSQVNFAYVFSPTPNAGLLSANIHSTHLLMAVEAAQRRQTIAAAPPAPPAATTRKSPRKPKK